MTDRMSDERLAEIETRLGQLTLAPDRDALMEKVKWLLERQANELLAALKAERERVKELVNMVETIRKNLHPKLEAAEARLDAVRGLAEGWRTAPDEGKSGARATCDCADELEALISQEQ